jgi:putative ABC transport system permease protein
VAQRTSEIGLRVALGADRRTIVLLILRETAVVTIAGLVLGVAVVAVAGRAVQSMLFGLEAADPLTIASAIALLAAAAIAASYVPARRAARVDPLAALRYE